MVKICIMQADNRPSLDYLLKSQKVNKMFCDYLGYDYLFIEINNHKHKKLHPATKKIHTVNDFLQNNKYDILVFLDSDAWVQNGNWLNDIINDLINNDNKHGCFSRDPYTRINTFINSGSFILKVNDFTRKMYKNIIDDLNNNHQFHNKWPYDQYYISKYIYENKYSFNIFIPDILNTPSGKVLRHNWYKDHKMYEDLNNLILLKKEDYIINKTPFNIKENYDNQVFPNINENFTNIKNNDNYYIKLLVIIILYLFIIYILYSFFTKKNNHLLS